MSRSDDMAAEVRRVVFARVQADARRLENAVERALVTGECGVLVVRGTNGLIMYAELSLAVPYGHVYETVEHDPIAKFGPRP